MTVSEWLMSGWQTFGRFRLLLIVGFLFVAVYELVLSLIEPGSVISSLPLANGTVQFAYPVSGYKAAIVIILSLAISPLLYSGYQYLSLKAVRGEADLADMLGPLRRPVSVVGAAWLSSLIAALGILLLIVPGIIWSLKYMFAPLAAVDKELDALNALRESGEITAGHKWSLFGLGIVFSLFGIPLAYLAAAIAQLSLAWALIALIGGQLILIPWSVASYAAAYQALDGLRAKPALGEAQPPVGNPTSRR